MLATALLLALSFVQASASPVLPMGLLPRKDLFQAHADGYGVTPVPSINATKLLGLWYQMGENLFTQVTTEPGLICSTARYGLNPNGTISVLNHGRLNQPDGPVQQIAGWAQATNASAPAALTVHLQGVPVGAPLWVFGLGPATYGSDNQYEWFVASDAFNIGLFILARDYTTYSSAYNATVMTLLAKNGFMPGSLNAPVWIYQGDDCGY